MRRIKALDSQIINQIAAGEVVERPASVVKELLENSLDSGANTITVEIHEAGLGIIKITDNGCGIHQEDLKLAVTAHATSKVSDSDDLKAINSLGFRGEALASIGSIAKMTITSRTHDSAFAYSIEVHGGKIVKEYDAVADVGTTVTVDDLFYTAPVRRRFLKSKKTELAHIDNIIKRIILSSFATRFNIHYQNRHAYSLSPATNKLQQEKRIEKLLAKAFLQYGLDVHLAASGMHLHGWICNEKLNRRQSDWQYFYLNGRPIRDKLIQHAVRQAYANKLEEGFQPAYILYLEMDSSLVDVNVHPTKYEVRFADSRYIHDFIVSALANVLTNEKELVSIEPSYEYSSVETQHEYQKSSSEPRPYTQSSSLGSSSNFATTSPMVGSDYEVTPDSQNILGLPKIIMYDFWVLSNSGEQWILTDIQELVAQLHYDELSNPIEQESIKPLLLPETMILPIEDADKIEQQLDSFTTYGINMNRLGEQSFVIRSAAEYLRGYNLTTLITDISKNEQVIAMHTAIVNGLSLQFQHQGMDIAKVVTLYERFNSIAAPKSSFRNKVIWRIMDADTFTSLLA